MIGQTISHYKILKKFGDKFNYKVLERNWKGAKTVEEEKESYQVGETVTTRTSKAKNVEKGILNREKE